MRDALVSRILVAVATVTLVPSAAHALAGPPSGALIVRAELEPASDIVLGQQIGLSVEVLTDTGLIEPPRFPDIEIGATIVVRADRASTAVSYRIGDTRLTGRRFHYAIYPLRTGSFTIPPLQLSARSAGSLGTKALVRSGSSEPLYFDVARPEETVGVSRFVATRRLAVEQSFVRNPGELVVGDALVRTLSITADDVPGMLLPPPSHPEIDGIARYARAPLISQRIHRGRIFGARRESWTYVMERAGTYRLPELVVYWWEPGADSLHEETLPGVELIVSDGQEPSVAQPVAPVRGYSGREPEEPPNAPAGPAGGRPLALLAALVAVLVLAAALARRLPAAVTSLLRLRRSRADSERACFRRFERAARADDARAALTRLYAWHDRARLDHDETTLASWVERTADDQLALEVAALETSLFGAAPVAPPWSGRSLARRVAAARRRARHGDSGSRASGSAEPAGGT